MSMRSPRCSLSASAARRRPRVPRRDSTTYAYRHRRWLHRRRLPTSALSIPTIAPGTPTAKRFATSCAASAATSRQRPTSSLSHAAKPTSSRSSIGRVEVGSRRFPTAAARASAAASRRGSRQATPARSRSICRGSTVSSRSIGPRAPRASKPASTDPRSRTSFVPTASRSGTSRSLSSSRRSAVGSRPARAATTRRSTRT